MVVDALGTSLQWRAPETVADDLLDAVFALLRRSDQRSKAVQYVRGLLAAEGRKSIRKIAGLSGDKAAEQSLQHFVSCSPWEWGEVRGALARAMEQVIRPSAWVVRPLVIPKAGSCSVGVARRSVPGQAQAVNCQQAYGVWLASEDISVPVHWRLQLPGEWLEDPERRRSAGIPEGALAEPPLRCAVGAAVEMGEAGWGLGRRPVVFDCGEDRTGIGAALLTAAGRPFVTRISGSLRVMLSAETAMPGHGRRPVAAEWLMDAMRWKRRPVEWLDPDSGLSRTSLVVKVPLAAGTERGGRAQAVPQRPLSLLAEWRQPYERAARFWLTDLADTPAAVLLRLTKLTRRADRDFTDITDRVGIRDFEGRSYPGWHRHATLASVAHGAAVMETAREQALRPAAPVAARMRARTS